MDTILGEVVKVAGIFGLSWFSFWPALPAGLALGLHPLAVILVTTLSYCSGILIVLVPGERVKRRVMEHFGKQASQQSGEDTLIRRIWERYGVIGFGLLAPMTVGAQIGAVLGMILNIPPQRMFLWMSIGALCWAVVLTLLSLAGIQSLDAIF